MTKDLDHGGVEAARKELDALHQEYAAKGSLPGYSIILPRVIRAYLSALSETAAVEPVGVKPLEWKELSNEIWDAGEYRIERHDDTFYARSSAASQMYASFESAASLDEAKAACQSDRERRVRSALVAAPTDLQARLAEVEKERDGLRAALEPPPSAITRSEMAAGWQITVAHKVGSVTFWVTDPQELIPRVAEALETDGAVLRSIVPVAALRRALNQEGQ